MRVKLLLENEASVEKRRLWHLVDESCIKVADLTYFIKKQFYTSNDCKISLSLDGFLLRPQESIALLQDNDEITVKVLSPKQVSSSESSSSESDEEIKFKKDGPAVNKTPFQKNKIVNSATQVLQKVAKVITTNKSSPQLPESKEIAAKHLVQSNAKTLNSETVSKMNVEKQEHVNKLNGDKVSAVLNGSAVQEKVVEVVLKETIHNKGNGSMEVAESNNVEKDLAEKPPKDYSCFEKLTVPPDVGSNIAYKFSMAALYYRQQMNSEGDAAEKCASIAEKYRQLIEVLYNAEKYFQCIELCIEFQSSSSINTSDKEYAEHWKHKSAECASNTFYQNARYSEMLSALKYLSYDEQYDFLKTKDDCETYLVNLFKDHDKKHLLVEYYTKKKMFFKAAQMEVDFNSKVDYLCKAARQVLVSRNKVEELAIIEEITKVPLTEVKSNVKFDLLFYKMQIDKDVSRIKEIFLYYHKENNLLMILLTLLSCIKNASESFYEIIFSVIHLSLSYIPNFTKGLFKAVYQLSCNKKPDTEDILFSVFGMQRDVSNQSLIFYEDETKSQYLQVCSGCSSFKQNPQDHPRNGTEIEIEISLARTRISNILKNLMIRLIISVNNQLEKGIDKAFLAIHPESCAYEECSVSHEYPSSSSFHAGLNVFISLLELKAQCKQYYQMFLHEKKFCKEDLNTLLDLSQSYKTVFKLGWYLFFYISYTHVLDMKQYSDCFKRIPESVRTLLLTYIKTQWKSIEDADQFVDMNHFVSLSLFSHLLNRENPVAEKLLGVSEARKFRIENTVPRDFLSYIYLLYRKKDPVDAIKHVYRCIFKTVRYQEPDILTICELVEIPIIVFFLALSKLNPSSVIYLPDRMLAYKDLMNSVYSLNNEASIDIAVRCINNRNVPAMCNRFQRLLDMFTGINNARFKLISILHTHILSFKKGRYKYLLIKLACERLLLIYLVLLSNFNLLPETYFHLLLEQRKCLIDQFKHYPVQGNGKFVVLFNSISTASTEIKARKLLSEYLNLNNQNLVEYNLDVPATEHLTPQHLPSTCLVPASKVDGKKNCNSNSLQPQPMMDNPATVSLIVVDQAGPGRTSNEKQNKSCVKKNFDIATLRITLPSDKLKNIASTKSNALTNYNQQDDLSKQETENSCSGLPGHQSKNVFDAVNQTVVELLCMVTKNTNSPLNRSKHELDTNATTQEKNGQQLSPKSSLSSIQRSLSNQAPGIVYRPTLTENIGMKLVLDIKNRQKETSLIMIHATRIQRWWRNIMKRRQLVHNMNFRTLQSSTLVIQAWWREILFRRKRITDMLEKFKLVKISTLIIQRWWRITLLKINRRQREEFNKSLSELGGNYDLYFEMNGYCKPCLLHVSSESIKDHLKEGSDHFHQVELYNRFNNISLSLKKLEEMLCRVDSRNGSYFEIRRQILLQYDEACMTKNWAVAPQLEESISSLFNGIDQAIGLNKQTVWSIEDNALSSRSLKRRMPSSPISETRKQNKNR